MYRAEYFKLRYSRWEFVAKYRFNVEFTDRERKRERERARCQNVSPIRFRERIARDGMEQLPLPDAHDDKNVYKLLFSAKESRRDGASNSLSKLSLYMECSTNRG